MKKPNPLDLLFTACELWFNTEYKVLFKGTSNSRMFERRSCAKLVNIKQLSDNH